MKFVSLIIQIIVAAGLLNVWLLRFNKPTSYRGGAARSMPEEFAVYGLPQWSVWMIGGAKIISAFCLLLGIWLPALVVPAAALVIVLMIGAVVMHVKVNDPAAKAVPAGAMMALTVWVVLANAF